VAKPDDVLGKVLQLVRERGVHRIYVCTKHNKPVGVVTLTDILARMAQAADPLTHEIMERFA
jgi:CBS domain-containing protein